MTSTCLRSQRQPTPANYSAKKAIIIHRRILEKSDDGDEVAVLGNTGMESLFWDGEMDGEMGDVGRKSAGEWNVMGGGSRTERGTGGWDGAGECASHHWFVIAHSVAQIQNLRYGLTRSAYSPRCEERVPGHRYPENSPECWCGVLGRGTAGVLDRRNCWAAGRDRRCDTATATAEVAVARLGKWGFVVSAS